MTCATCSEYGNEPNAIFVKGSRVFRQPCVASHDASDAHNNCVRNEKSRKNPSETIAAKTLKVLNVKTVGQLVLKFKNAHYISKFGKPYTDYITLCNLDEAKNLDIGSQYRCHKAAVDFSACIAEAERVKIRNKLKKTSFISVISDGTTDSSFQETEIVYIRSSIKGRVSVNFSMLKNIAKADAYSICDVLVNGMKNLCPEYKNKLVATNTDGASTMLGTKTGVVQQLREHTDKPYLVGIHCSGHKLELAFRDTAKSKIPWFLKVETMLLSLYYFYRNSNLNRNGLHLRDAQQCMPEDLTGNDSAFLSAKPKFLSSILTALSCRFMENPGIIESCSPFSLSLFPAREEDLQEYGDEGIDTLVDHFRPALEDAGVEVAKIAGEWTKLKTLMVKRFSIVQAATWEEINSKLGLVCPNILQLADLVLTIPASSADAERGFSRLKKIKTDKRTRLLDSHLSDQMIIMLESASVKEYDPMPAIDIWNYEPRRTRQTKAVKKLPVLVDDMAVQVSVENSLPLQTVDFERIPNVNEPNADVNNNIVTDTSSDKVTQTLPVSTLDKEVQVSMDLNNTRDHLSPTLHLSRVLCVVF